VLQLVDCVYFERPNDPQRASTAGTPREAAGAL
jgi:hypothetical protein